MAFRIVSKFQEAARAINSVPVDRFPLILGRIIQKLHLKDSRFFTEDEEEQLKSTLELSASDLKTTLDCCSYIYEQAAFSSTGPEPLFEVLLEAGFDEAHAKVIGRTWAAEASEYISRLKQAQGMGHPSGSSLVRTDYHLNMVLGQSDLSRQQEPSALFEFTIREGESNANNNSNNSNNNSSGAEGGQGAAAAADSNRVMDGASAEKLLVEFSHEELFAFFGQLERVQQQLDALGNTTTA